MQPLVNEILQCIIHKPVARNAAFALKHRAGHTHPKVRTGTLCIGSGMTGMCGTFVDDLQVRRLQNGLQPRLNRSDSRQGR